VLDNQEHRFDRGLPLGKVLLRLRKLLDIFGGVLEIGSSNARFQPCQDFILRRLMRMCARCERR
jgi:hypothetical protein